MKLPPVLRVVNDPGRIDQRGATGVHRVGFQRGDIGDVALAADRATPGPGTDAGATVHRVLDGVDDFNATGGRSVGGRGQQTSGRASGDGQYGQGQQAPLEHVHSVHPFWLSGSIARTHRTVAQGVMSVP